ncbi:MAG TPA: response regulator, partial [Beijerinckiaceae bacterium]|nr:response regulator [Beijerinckiaceae bacterium]
GTGLGLAISKRIIEAMGGTIGVESQEGVGSEFWFEIPCRAVELPLEIAVSARSVRDVSRPVHILVAEDIPTNQLVIAATLRRMGHSVTVVGNGAEAIDRVQAAQFDLVFLDMQMPVMDGIEAARKIKALGGAFAYLPLVAMTANAFETDREACREAGMIDFLTKPIDANQIAAAIHRLTSPRGGDLKAAHKKPPHLDLGRLGLLASSLGAPQTEKILDLFAQDAATLVDDIARAARNDNTLDLAAAAASLDSALSVLGFGPARSLCADLAVASDGRKRADKSVIALRKEIERGLIAARRLVREMAGRKPSIQTSQTNPARRAA